VAYETQVAYETFIAFRHLRSRKKASVSIITVICTLGVVLGVAALVTVLSVTGGFQEVFREKVLGLNSHVLIMKYGLDFHEHHDVVERALAVPEVLGAAPFIFHEMMLSAGTELSGVLVKGVDPALVGSVSDLPSFMEQGSVQDMREGGEGETPGILLGAELALRLGLEVGQPVSLVSPLRGMDPTTWGPRDTRPTSETFEVVGVFRSGFHEYDARLVYVHLGALQRFFGQGDTVTGVELKVADIFRSRQVADSVRVRLGDQRYAVRDWSQDESRGGVLSRMDRARRTALGGFAGGFALLALLALLTWRLGRGRSRVARVVAVAVLAVLAVGLVRVGSRTGWAQAWIPAPELDLVPHITVVREDAAFLEYRNAVQEAEMLPEVSAAGPVIVGKGELTPKGALPGSETKVSIRGYSVTAGVTRYGRHVVEGSSQGMVVIQGFGSVKRTPGALLGKALADAMGVSPGDEVVLLAGAGDEVHRKELRVVGLVETGVSAIDDRSILVDFVVAKRMLATLDAAGGIEVRVRHPLDAPRVAHALRARLGGHSYRTLDWKEINRNLFTSLELQKKVLTLIVFAMVIVAMFNIVSTLFIIVVDKSREISILKSMGATSGGVLRVFMIEGVSIGGVGTLLGLLLGVFACWVISQIDFPLDPKIYLIPSLPVRPVVQEFVITGVVAVLTSVVATVYPSLKAASLPPVEGLRQN
jgi:ABC-type lipoprotein release transport system permease subunit